MTFSLQRCLGWVLVSGLVLAVVCQGSYARQAAGQSKIVLGEFPPDFELPVLTLDRDADGKPVGRISDSETVKLSSFRGQRPVCLWMSSYT